MSLEVRCPERLQEAREYAKTLGQEAMDCLEERLKFLTDYGDDNECVLDRDFAPFSFAFGMYRKNSDGSRKFWFNGGLIYHGPTQPGNGSMPALSVSLCDHNRPRWEIHT